MIKSTTLKLKALACLIMFIPIFVQGQIEVSGLIMDAETSEPLIGASILAKGTSVGTTTDIDGRFSLTMPAGIDAIVISYIGYQTQEKLIGTDNYFEISLSLGEILTEVIVIGYGTVKREDATGAIQNLNSKDFNLGSITSPQELINGKIAGVVVNTGGDPGGGSTIRIRGESSLSASNDPLIVIDGIPLSNEGISGSRNPLNFINPNDIESISVLKDASATAIYGNRASGGVILVTTKKSSVNQPLKLGYNAQVSIGKINEYVDVLNATEYRELLNSLYDEGSPQLGLIGNADTDWQKEIYENAIGQDHTLSLSGSQFEIPFRASVGFTDKGGILKTDKFTRYSGSLNLNPGFIDNRLQLNIGLRAAKEKNHFADRGAIGNSINFDPTHPVLDETSPYGGFYTWTIPNGNPNTLAPTNPLALLSLKNDESDVNRYVANLSADYRFGFLPELRANINVGYDKAKGSGTIVVPTNASFAFDQINGGGTNNIYEKVNTNKLIEYYMNYGRDLGNQSFDVMAGYSWQHFHITDMFTNSDFNNTPAETNSDSRPKENFLVSVFGRLNYEYNNRILFTATVRRDGTSRFVDDNRYGLFPAAGLGIKLIDGEGTINNLKLRVGWGITGQQDIGSNWYPALANYQASLDNASYQFGNTFVTTLRPNGYDANLKWEETTTYNFGIDFGLFDRVITGSIDYYQKETKDLLNFIPVPAGTNLTNFITTNIGDMKSQGFELGLNVTAISTRDVDWKINLNTSYNKAEITRLTATNDPTYEGVLTGGIAGGVGSNIQIHSVGYAPSSFYVYEQLFDDEGKILEGQFVDRNEDGIVNDLDKYRYKKPAPDWTYGFASNVRYKNLDFSFSGRMSKGNYIYNNVHTELGFTNRVYDSTNALRNIHQAGVDNNVAAAANIIFSDFFVRDGSFLRIDNISLGYSFGDLIGHDLRLTATVQNPFLSTSYDGLDPEIFNGIDNNIYPRPTNFVFGLNVEF